MAVQIKNPNYDPNNPNSKRFISLSGVTDVQNDFNTFMEPFDLLDTATVNNSFVGQKQRDLSDLTVTANSTPNISSALSGISIGKDGKVQTKTPTIPTPSAPSTPTADIYTVQSGDTLGALASKFGTTVQEIVKVNGISNPNLINVGQKLTIPTGGAPTTGGTGAPSAPTGTPTSKEATANFIAETAKTGRLSNEDMANLANEAGKAGLSPSEFMDIISANALPTEEESREIRNKLGIPDLIDTAFEKPSKSTIETYRELYSMAGLTTIKGQIKEINDSINKKRADLVTATGELNENPWISQATRAGRLRNLQELAFADINNDLEAKQQYLDLYDQGVDEIERQIGFITGDQELERALTVDKLNFLLTEAERDEELISRNLITEGLRTVPDFLKGTQDREALQQQRELALRQASKTTPNITINGQGVDYSEEDAINRTENYMLSILENSAGGKAMDVSSRDTLRKSVTVVNQLSDLASNLEGESVDPILGIIRSNNPYDEKAQLIQAQLTSIIPNLARGVYGEVGVLTEADVELYRQTIPNLKTTEDTKNLLMAMTVRTVQRGLEDQLELSAQTGLDVSGLIPIYNRLQQTVTDINGRLGISADDTRRASASTTAVDNYLDTLDFSNLGSI